MIPPAKTPLSGTPGPSAKPTLEALLRLKREERPDDAFWADFQRGLEQKQLAAIVEPRPWWMGLAVLGRRFGALGLPVSASAAALLAIMVVRTQSPLLISQGPVEFGPASSVVPSTKSSAEAPVVAKVDRTAVVAADMTSFVEPSPEVAERVGVLSGEIVASVEKTSENVRASDAPGATASVVVSPVIASISVGTADVESVDVVAEPTASQITIAQNLAAVTEEAPELIASVAPSLEFTSLGTSQGVERELEAVNPRQARLLALAEMPDVTESKDSLARVRERMVHRLDSDESSYASASRLGYGADRLSLRF